MIDRSELHVRSGARLGGVGAIVFAVSTFVALFLSNAPGGNYSASDVSRYLSHGHRAAELVAMTLALIGVLGLVCLLAYLRETIRAMPEKRRAGDIVWGTGIAAAASFAIGWGVAGGQVVAHLEGGSAIVVPAPITYLISEIGVMFIFGSGAILLGFALIVLMVSSRGLFPTWVRRLTLGAGVLGVVGPAFFTFFALMLCIAIFGVWTLASARASTSRVVAAQPST